MKIARQNFLVFFLLEPSPSVEEILHGTI